MNRPTVQKMYFYLSQLLCMCAISMSDTLIGDSKVILMNIDKALKFSW